jgi:cellulose synthase/poly-beta-1,6-N-acetylglucosamine synthase-like glycosyltransferase
MMNTEFFTTTRMAGILLLLYVLVILGAVVLIAVQGRLGGMAAAFRGVGPQTGDASGLRTIARLAIPANIVLLAGFALLAMLLYEAGDRGAAIAALTLLVFSATISAVEGTFQANVTVWAAEEAARTGAAPEFYEPLRRWVNGDIQLVYMSFFLSAMLLFSWAALYTGLFSPWIGWAALAWSLLSFPLYFLVFGAPLVIVVFPLLFGVGLLLVG